MALDLRSIGISLATDLGFAALLLLLLHITRPAYLAFRRRRSGFGIVFDSVTGLPVDRATVSLRDLHGQLVRTVVTEKDGRYRLMAPKGEYRVEVVKAGFTYPSVHFHKQKENAIYDNLLPTDHIVIKDHGAITKNIAMDHVEKRGIGTTLGKNLVLPKGVQVGIAVLSPLMAVGMALLHSSWTIWTLFACYIIALVNRLFSFSPPQPPFGTVRDAATGEPMQGVVVRILNSKFNKLLETQVTSPKGRYAFIIDAGAYRILFTKRGYKGVVLNFPHIKEARYLLAKDVRMAKIPTRLTPLTQNLRGTLEHMPEAKDAAPPPATPVGDFS